MLDKTMRINALYDFYQILLTVKQQDYMSLYYLNDYSLGEIADEFNVSRQAVYDNLKRTEVILESFEEKLALFRKYQERLKLFSELRAALSMPVGKQDKVIDLIDQLEKVD